MEISDAKYKAELELAKNDFARALKEKNDEKAKLEQAKLFLENKLQELKKSHEESLKTLADKLRTKDQEVLGVKGISD